MFVDNVENLVVMGGVKPSIEGQEAGENDEHFDDFAGRMIANMRFNGYTKKAVLAPAVRQRFAEKFAAHDGRFDQPVRIDYFCP